MKEYGKENKWVILALFIVGILTYGIRLISSTISIDTECVITDQVALCAGWFSMGRYVLAGIKYLEMIPFNIYVANIGMFIFFFLSILVWIRQLEKLFGKRNKIANLLFGLIILTTPILAEQFGYTLQNIEVAFAFLLFSLGMGPLQKYVYENSKINGLISLLLFSITFGMYQGFVPLFVSLCVFIHVVKEETDGKKSFQAIAKYLLMFILLIGIYYLGGTIAREVLQIESSSYFKEQIYWGQESITSTVFRTAKSVGATMLRIWYQI